MARGTLLLHDTVVVNDDEIAKTSKYEFVVTTAMSPTVTVIVTQLINNEILSDSIKINVSPKLENKVRMKIIICTDNEICHDQLGMYQKNYQKVKFIFAFLVTVVLH